MKKNIYRYLLLFLSLLAALPARAHHPDSDGDEFVEKVSQRLAELKAYNEANIARGEAEKNVYVLDLSRLDDDVRVHDLGNDGFPILNTTKDTLNQRLIKFERRTNILCYVLIATHYIKYDITDHKEWNDKRQEWTNIIFNRSQLGDDGALVMVENSFVFDNTQFSEFQTFTTALGKHYNEHKSSFAKTNIEVYESSNPNESLLNNTSLILAKLEDTKDQSELYKANKWLVKESFTPTGGNFKEVTIEEKENLLNEAIDRFADNIKNAIRNYPAAGGQLYKKGDSFHIINKGQLKHFSTEDRSSKQYQILEDRLKFLKEETGIEVYAIYDHVDFIFNRNDNSINDFAEEVLKKVSIDYPDKKIAIVTIPYAYPEKYITGVNWQYVMPGVAMSKNMVSDGLEDKQYESSFEVIFNVYKNIKKPCRIYYGLLNADGVPIFSSQDLGEKSGYGFINGVFYFINPGFRGIQALPKPEPKRSKVHISGTGGGTFILTDDDLVQYFLDLFLYRVEVDNILAEYNDKPVEDGWELAARNNLKEKYIRDYYAAYGYKFVFEQNGFIKWGRSLNELLPRSEVNTEYYDCYSNFYRAVNSQEVSFANIAYDFNVKEVVGQTVYGAADIISLIPAAGNLGDFIGLGYALVFDNSIEEAQPYIIGLGSFVAGAAVVKGIQKYGKYVIRGVTTAIEATGNIGNIITHSEKSVLYFKKLFGIAEEVTVNNELVSKFVLLAKNKQVDYSTLKLVKNESTDAAKIKKLSDILEDVVKGAGKTTPSKIPDINAKPRGSKTVISEADDAATRRSLLRENESAETLAKHGYDIEQNPIVHGTTKKPDYLVENKIFDCYSPSSSNARNIASNIELKVTKEQAKRIILNLDDSTVSFSVLKGQLSNYPIQGLEEIIIIKGNQVTHFYPF